jgi:predicted phosphoribosyltransferase
VPLVILDKIRSKFQLKFKDRVSAGNILSEALKGVVKKDEEKKNSIVLGIARGGVLIADNVASYLANLA